jgi:hypothetical protein
MKTSILTALFISLFMAFHSSIHSQTILVLDKNESYQAPLHEEMIVMDIRSFGKYHYTASQYDTLKQQVKHLDSLLTIQDSSQAQLIQRYESLLVLKQQEINQYQSSYKRLENATNGCIKAQNQLQIDYQKIEQKNRRIKKWRNWFMGTTALLGTIMVMSVVR